MVKSAAIVLVHGPWADGSSWNRVIPLLQAKKFPVIAVQNPLTSVKDDVEATSRIRAVRRCRRAALREDSSSEATPCRSLSCGFICVVGSM